MNCRTRGERIDAFLEDAKRFLVTTLLVIWGVLTLFFGVGMVANGMRVHELEEELANYEQVVKKEEDEDSKWVVVVDEKTGKIIYSEPRVR